MAVDSQRLWGASLAILVSAASLAGGVAFAQSSDDDEEDTIIVTGTSIRGVAPVGSSLQSVGQVDVERSQAINLSALVNTIPALTTNGSLAQGENVWSYYSPQIHSLAGSSSNTTLVVIDGMRMPGGGAQFNQTDPNIIPTPAISRVDVLADGASSVYGSDAVAGVVNFVTRRTFDGLQTNSSYGFADSYYNWDLNGIWGHTWETGGVYVASQYTYQSELLNKDREFSSRGDYRDIGGTNTNSFNCDPSTIIVQGVSEGDVPGGIFLSPTATESVPFAGVNAECNNSVYATIVPTQYRVNGLIRVVNDFSDRLSISASMNYNRNKTIVNNAPGNLTATAFGPGAGEDGQQNPFFVAPTGAPNANQEQIRWLALRDDGDYGQTVTKQDVIYGNVVADYNLNDNWLVTFSNSFGFNYSTADNEGTFCDACASLALNGSSNANGSITSTRIPGMTVLAYDLPLTVDNALDVWNAGAANQTNPLVMNSLYVNNGQNRNENTFDQARIALTGDLFELPAGPLKIAVGGEYMWLRQQFKLARGPNLGPPSITGESFSVLNFYRYVKSAFGEAVIPVVSPDMNIPLLRQIDLSVAVRTDDFNDLGDTTNPKYGFNWEVIEGFRLRGNYAESFVAPPLALIGDPELGYLYASGSVTPTGELNVTVSAYPEVVDVVGSVEQGTTNPCTTSSAVCTIGQGNQAMRRQLGGGFTNLGPQFGESWSLGADLAPTWLSGFRGAATFFHNEFIGGVNSPSTSSIASADAGLGLLTICPTGCTDAQILEFANVANGAVIGGSIPDNVYYMIDQSTRNWLNLLIEGVDTQFDYTFPLSETIDMRLGYNSTYFTKFDQRFGMDDWFSVLNTAGFNGTFPSIRYKSRSYIGFDWQDTSVDLFWNYTGSYRNWAGSSVNPRTNGANGLPNGGGDEVDADNTFDLHVQQRFGVGQTFDDLTLTLDVRNIADEEPQFYNGNVGGFQGGAWGYNNYVSNPVGRLVTVGLRTNF